MLVNFIRKEYIVIKWIESYDDSRIVTYESWYCDKKGRIDVEELSIYNRMYGRCSVMKSYGRTAKKPAFLCEYSHAMGNSNGDVADYQKIFEKYDSLMGGCIWEWNDHNALGNYGDYKNVPLYGGEFGEKYHDGNFCVDGLVDCYRQPKSGLRAVKEVFCPFEASYKNGVLSIKNKNYFLCSQDCADILLLIKYADGREETQMLSCNIPPQNTYKMPFSKKGLQSLCVSFINNRETGLISKGEQLGFQQVFVKKQKQKLDETYDEFVYDEKTYCVKNNEISVNFNPRDAEIVSLQYRGNELLTAPIQLNILRAPIDNDMYIKKYWETVGLMDSKVEVRSVEQKAGALQINLACVVDNRENIFNGSLVIGLKNNALMLGLQLSVNENIEFLPRLGLVLGLDKSFEQVGYFGYGSDESYIDKHSHCIKGEFGYKVEDAVCPYLKPQEYGSHCGCSWVDCISENIKMHVFSDEEFSFSALPYSIQQLTETAHNYELKKEDCVYLCLDDMMSGLGSASCGQKLVKPYRADKKTINRKWVFVFKA